MQNAEPGNDRGKPRSRRFQFSLGSLLLATTVVCLWLGTQVNAARRQREVASAVERLGGKVYYDWLLDGDDPCTTEVGPPGPAWLRLWIGDDFFQTAVQVTIWYVPCGDDQLPAIEQLQQVRTLSLEASQIGNASLPRLSRLRRLTFLNLSETNVNDEGMETVAQMRQLKALWVAPAKGQATGMVTDVGVSRLATLTNLESLAVGGKGITDASLPVFEQFPELDTLFLFDTAITPAGIARLRKARPACRVITGVDEY